MKNSLYTNITHKFKTPLTSIQGMTDSVLLDIESGNFEEVKAYLGLIRRNSDGLLHLVNEMLDLAKLEKGNMEVHLEQGNVVPFVKYVSENFNSLAHDAQVNLVVYSEMDELIMDFDATKLASIVSNVLSNALKFTPKNGKVIVQLGESNEYQRKHFFIQVKDNGRGIAKEDIKNIFNRYFQLDNSSFQGHKIAGIGLALTKELVSLLGGTIVIKSEPGEGTTLSIKIPITNKAPYALIFEPREQNSHNSTSSPKSTPDLNVHDDLPLLLIIEENNNVAYYLKSCLKKKYRTMHASNGILGVEMALKYIPDIIMCNIIMPGKNGFEICITLKSDERTNHIPLILLTAKASVNDLVGLSLGADAYLVKPFVKEELFTSLDQLILLRNKTIFKSQNNGISQLSKPQAENPEAKFLHKVISIIHKDINDYAFGSARLAHELHLSESQVYRKLKFITGKSTALFIRSIRLQKGKELILTTEKNISEVSYDVGFNDPSWFSRTFKQEFGVSPSEIKK